MQVDRYFVHKTEVLRGHMYVAVGTYCVPALFQISDEFRQPAGFLSLWRSQMNGINYLEYPGFDSISSLS